MCVDKIKRYNELHSRDRKEYFTTESEEEKKKKKKVAVLRARWRVSRSLLIVITSAR